MSDEDAKELENSSSASSSLQIDAEQQQENKERLQRILDSMTKEELQRYETFRRAGFNKSGIRKFVNNILGQACNPNFIIAVAGVSKVFVGEMVEMAKETQKEEGGKGPLKPSHIHEAYRKLYKTMPHLNVSNKNKWL